MADVNINFPPAAAPTRAVTAGEVEDMVIQAKADVEGQVSAVVGQVEGFDSRLSDKVTLGLLGSDITPGTTVNTQGFYSVGDGGSGVWTLKNSTGSEVWTSTGHGFDISNDGEIKFDPTKKLVFTKSEITTKQMGCKADGVSNDSVVIKKMFASPKFTQIAIYPGIHIINITPGTTHAERIFCVAKVPVIRGLKGKSIIKLGSGNGDERIFTGFQALFEYQGIDMAIDWDGVTFDYNPANNPLFHYTTRYKTTEENIRHAAIQARDCGDFSVTNCTFDGHSGANCVWWIPHYQNTKDVIAKVVDCKFINIGAETGQGIHDVSTIYLHNYPTKYVHNTRKTIAHVYGNQFIASEVGAPNAFNWCEVSTDESFVHDNYVFGYWIGGYDVSESVGKVSKYYKNIAKEVCSGYGIWTWKLNDVGVSNETPAYAELEIKDNTFYINPSAFANKTNYEEFAVGTSGFVQHNSPGIYFASAYRDIDVLNIDNNIIKYMGTDGYEIRLNAHAINFGGVNIQGRANTPKIDNLNIKKNKIYNAPQCVLYYSSFPDTNKIIIKDNEAYNCNKLVSTTAPFNHAFFLIMNGTINPAYAADNKVFTFENNTVIGDNHEYICNFTMEEAGYTYTGNITFKNTKFNKGANLKRPYTISGYISSAVVEDKYELNTSDLPLIDGFVNVSSKSIYGEMSFKNAVYKDKKWTVYAIDTVSIPALTYKRGDEIIITAPVAGGYSRYVNVSTTATPSWKGIGLIQA